MPEPKDVIFPELRTNEDSHLLCKKLRGEMTVTDSQAKQNALVKEFKRARPDDFNDIGKMYRVYLQLTCSQTYSYFLQLNSGLDGMTTKMKENLQIITLAKF